MQQARRNRLGAAASLLLAAAVSCFSWAEPSSLFGQDQQTSASGSPYPEMDPRRHEELRPFHDIVSTWQDGNGKSCCDETDCQIVEDYIVGTNKETGEEEYSVLVFGRWWTVPGKAVRPYTSVTYGVVACYYWVWELDGKPHPEFRCVVGPHNS